MKTNFIKTLFVTLFLLSVNIVNAHDFEVDGIYYKITDATNKTVAVTYSGSFSSSVDNEYTGSVVIPESVVYNGKVYSVTSIGRYAFWDCSGLKSITIPNSVTSIGEEAFYNCSGLTSIEIPNSVTNIGNSAFYNCSGLTSVVIPNSVTSIESFAFYSCSGLTSITIPNSVTSIGYQVFYGCSGLTSIEIPNSVTSIGSYAFYGCSGLTSIEIPNSVTSIGGSAFNGCSGLTGIEIPNSVTSIGNSAFYGCSGLTSIVIPNGVTSIGYRAFADCSGLKSVTIGNGVTSIGESAFDGCSGLTSITIPNSVTSIGNSAFDGCSGLTSITIPNGVTSIGEEAFYDCSGLTSITIPNSVTSIGNYAFYGCKGLTSITIPNSVTSIGDYAFYGWSGLKSIVIPNSVTSIGNSAFYRCSNLKTVINLSNLTFSKGSSDYGSVAYYADIVINDPKATFVGDFVFSTVDDKHTLVAYLGNATEITLPDNYNGENYVIGKYAFYYCKGLTSITIPNSVTSIGNYAFAYCSGLTSIVIPNSVTSIGGSAFKGCSGLTSIEIPNSVTSIGSYAFYGCSGLTSIEIPNSVTSIGGSAFNGCSGLTGIEIPNSVTSIGNSAFYGCSGLTSIVIPNGVTSIGYRAFADCSGLKSVTIGNGVTSIGESAFDGCSGLTSITIPNSVTSIGNSAFDGCSGLTSITIPNGVTSIGEEAFYDCSNLKTVINLSNLTFSKSSSDYGYVTYYADKVINAPNGGIVGDFVFSTVDGKHTLLEYSGNASEIILPDNYKGEKYAIGNNVFKNKSSITSITIPNSVTSIGNYAFYHCSSLTSITIPNSVTSIGDYAFYWCYHITSITIPNSVTSIGDYAFYGWSRITSITIPNSVTSIGNYAFNGCDGLKTVVNFSSLTLNIGSQDYGYVAYYADKVINAPNGGIVGDFVFSTVDGKHTLLEYSGNASEIILPDNYKGEKYAIGNNVFKNKSSITSITIPNSVTNIGDSAFDGCSGLTSIEIPNSVTSIGDNAFYDCTKLTSIEIPNSVTSIGNDAFQGCSGLTSITIPNSVTSIGYSAFYDCTKLTSIEIPNSVTSIGNDAFQGCSGLTSITIPNSVTSIGYSAFKGCNNIKFLEINTSSVGTMFRDMKSLRKLVIGNDVENIPDNAFNGCSNLSSVTVGSKIKEIKSYSFNGCNNIAKVFWLTNTPPTGYEYLFGKINYVSNNKYTKLENKVVTQFLSSNFEIDGIVYIPTSLADRKCCVADYNPGVNNRGVSIPSTVTYQGVELIVGDIMPHAFYKNELVGAVALENKGMIGKSAFESCNNLTRVEIPQSITRIEDHAFRNCTALTDAFFFDRETQLPLGAQLFAECPLDTLYLGAKIEYISEASESTSPFCGNKSLKTVIITDVETDIYDYEFYGCSGLEMAVVGDGVERIGRWTFSGCSSLKNFTFGSNVSTIGEEAFSDCTAVTNITGRAVQPPVCGAQALDDINKWNCTLSVPSQNGNSYKTAEQWKEFIKIENIVTSNNYVSYILEGEVYKTLLLTPGKRIIAPYVADKENAPFTGWDLDEYMQDVTIDGHTKIVTETITKTVTRIDTIRASKKPININIKDNADAMLYCNAPCYGSQWTDDNFTSWSVLFDNDPRTFLHTSYTGDAQSTDGLDHYLRVDLGEGNEIKDFVFNYTTRASANSDFPQNFIIEGSNDNVNYKEITRIENGLPTNSGQNYTSEIISNDTPYRYIRFMVTKTTTDRVSSFSTHNYWHIAEFGMAKIINEEEYREVTETITEEVAKTITEKITLRYPIMPDRDIIVYGSYAVNEYTITYIVDGEVFATDSIAYGSEITLREQPTKEGYTFSGWSEAPTTMPARDITIEGTFILDDTAIDDVEVVNKEKTVYDLKGNRILDIENLERGIYIINGKKVLVK